MLIKIITLRQSVSTVHRMRLVSVSSVWKNPKLAVKSNQGAQAMKTFHGLVLREVERLVIKCTKEWSQSAPHCQNVCNLESKKAKKRAMQTIQFSLEMWPGLLETICIASKVRHGVAKKLVARWVYVLSCWWDVRLWEVLRQDVILSAIYSGENWQKKGTEG